MQWSHNWLVTVSQDDNHDEVCEICRESGELLLCDTCNLVYHMTCLDPPLTAVPPGMWLCPKCKVSTIPGSKIAVHSCSKAPCKRTQHCRMLHVASVCPPCCMLLRVFWSCCGKIETGQTLCQQLPTFLLFRDRRSVARLCWIRLHSSSNVVGATHAH